MLVTGMIIGAAFTLFVVPAIYMLIATDRARKERREISRPLEVTADELIASGEPA